MTVIVIKFQLTCQKTGNCYCYLIRNCHLKKKLCQYFCADGNPAIQARLCIFSWWLRFWGENRELHQSVRKAWKRALFHSPIRQVSLEASTRLHVYRCCNADDLGWTPHELAEVWWEYAGGTFTTFSMKYTNAKKTRNGPVQAHTWTALDWSTEWTCVFVTNNTLGLRGNMCMTWKDS